MNLAIRDSKSAAGGSLPCEIQYLQNAVWSSLLSSQWIIRGFMPLMSFIIRVHRDLDASAKHV
jgi:hypothetical protein